MTFFNYSFDLTTKRSHYQAVTVTGSDDSSNGFGEIAAEPLVQSAVVLDVACESVRLAVNLAGPTLL